MDAVYCVLFEVGGGRERGGEGGVWYYKHAFFSAVGIFDVLVSGFRSSRRRRRCLTFSHRQHRNDSSFEGSFFSLFLVGVQRVCVHRALGFSHRVWARAGVSA